MIDLAELSIFLAQRCCATFYRDGEFSLGGGNVFAHARFEVREIGRLAKSHKKTFSHKEAQKAQIQE